MHGSCHASFTVDSFAIDESDHGEAAVLHPGSYAVVQCEVESFLRCLQTDPASFGEAGGHFSLAMEGGVTFAGEVQVDHNMEVVAWNLKSGTYTLPNSVAPQCGLPMHLYWEFVEDFKPEDHRVHLHNV